MKTLEEYIREFEYQSIPAMKISSKELIKILPENNVQVIDIRFKEEYEVWHSSLLKNIPLNELPDRLDELDKDKLIVTACPHNIRSNIAMHYLKTKGFNVKFLSDGLTTLLASLLGGGALSLYNALEHEEK